MYKDTTFSVTINNFCSQELLWRDVIFEGKFESKQNNCVETIRG